MAKKPRYGGVFCFGMDVARVVAKGNAMCNIIKGILVLPPTVVVIGAMVCVGKIILLAFTILAGIVAVVAPFILQLATILTMLWLIGKVASVICRFKKGWQ